MKLPPSQKEIYGKDHAPALKAQRLAQEIVFAPVVFQISRLMIKFGILDYLIEEKNGRTMDEIIQHTKLSKYAVKILLEASLSIGTVLVKEDKFYISKVGFYLLKDEMAQINMNFNHDVNYMGLFYLEEALLNGRPEGLKVFGEWPTIYEGLSQLPPQVQKSWFGFDHFYSDHSFDEALAIVFGNSTKTLLDVGGNTGRFATRCVQHSQEVNVTIMDLPQQLEMMRKQTAELPEANRIHGHGANLLDENVPFPKGFDAIWMSQFLDCFSEEQVVSILSRAAASMDENSTLYIMETIWDRQHHETGSYCLTQISVYFTAMANGNSKMFYSEDLGRMIDEAGLVIEKIDDNLGKGHSLIQCKRKK